MVVWRRPSKTCFQRWIIEPFKMLLCCMLCVAESLRGLRTCKSPMFLKITVQCILMNHLSDGGWSRSTEHLLCPRHRRATKGHKIGSLTSRNLQSHVKARHNSKELQWQKQCGCTVPKWSKRKGTSICGGQEGFHKEGNSRAGFWRLIRCSSAD